jgi:hypothetical protein
MNFGDFEKLKFPEKTQELKIPRKSQEILTSSKTHLVPV